MPRQSSRILTAAVLCAALTLLGMARAQAAEKPQFRIAWSIYVGWMPWGYAKDSGIVDKWADKYGIGIDVVQINDYIESINQYTAGAFDGCTMTNMDALTIPAAGGVDSTGLIVGDFSDGNDAILLKGRKDLAQIKGLPVNLVELSVSHYLLARGLASVGLSERDIQVVNTSDADIVGAYQSPDVQAVVTWNPQKNEILKQPDTYNVFDSADIPGEIIDLLVVNTETLKANPALGKALTGAWYETMREVGLVWRDICGNIGGIITLFKVENDWAENHSSIHHWYRERERSRYGCYWRSLNNHGEINGGIHIHVAYVPGKYPVIIISRA